jgi:hypothetical protein
MIIYRRTVLRMRDVWEEGFRGSRNTNITLKNSASYSAKEPVGLTEDVVHVYCRVLQDSSWHHINYCCLLCQTVTSTWEATSLNTDICKDIPIVQPTRCTCYLKLFIFVKRSTCFGRSFHPSPGAQNCTYSNGICQTAAATCCYRGWDGTLVPSHPR